jgi:hypothetical protein
MIPRSGNVKACATNPQRVRYLSVAPPPLRKTTMTAPNRPPAKSNATDLRNTQTARTPKAEQDAWDKQAADRGPKLPPAPQK